MPMNLNHPSFNFGEAMQQFNAKKRRQLTQRIHLSFKRSFRKMKRSFYTRGKKPMVIEIVNKQIKPISIFIFNSHLLQNSCPHKFLSSSVQIGRDLFLFVPNVSGSGFCLVVSIFITSSVCNAVVLALCQMFLHSQTQVVVQVCRL